MVDKHNAQLKKLDCDAGDNYLTMQEIITILLTIQTFILHRVPTISLR